VATVKGNRFSILPQPGRIVPSRRAVRAALDANLFEAVGAASQTRTIQYHADAALRVVASVFVEADSRAWVANSLERLSDAGQWIVRPIQREVDLALQINRLLSARGDTHQAVFVKLEKISDSRQLVVRTEAREAATRQTVFAVLIRESHEIQT
jgi:hypothetical protein